MASLLPPITATVPADHPDPSTTILIADDNPDGRLTLELLLEEEGYRPWPSPPTAPLR
jgi:hypothetical protein